MALSFHFVFRTQSNKMRTVLTENKRYLKNEKETTKIKWVRHGPEKDHLLL